VAIAMVAIGVFVVIPKIGAFGVFWTLIVLAFAVYHGINLFSARGLAHEVIDLDTPAGSVSGSSVAQSPEQRLEKLDGLKRKGLVSSAEYEEQRQRILDGI